MKSIPRSIKMWIVLGVIAAQPAACVLENSRPETLPENAQVQTAGDPAENTPLPVQTRSNIQETQPTPFPTPDFGDDFEAIQLAWYYRPPASGDIESVAKNYSSFILTRLDERGRDYLKNSGIQTPVLQYLLFNEIMDPGSCTDTPYKNQVADKIGDFCSISNKHPDWFLKDIFGNEISNSSGFYIMDPGNLEWRTFWLERMRKSQEELGWQGVFLDNVEASLKKRIKNAGLPNNYPNDASYQKIVEDYLRFLYLGYFKPQGRPLYANIISYSDPNVWFRYLQYLDGVMLEDFAVGWGEDYYSAATWEMQMDLAEKTQALGKKIILVAQGKEFDSNRQVFSLASYLLVNNGNAYFRYTNANSYNQSWLYDIYRIELGKPLGYRYKEGDTWIRDFEKGQVIVNPSMKTGEINVK